MTINTLALDAATITTLAAIAAAFPRTAYGVIGIVGAVAAPSIAGSALGLTVLIVALGAALALADRGTVDTGYLDRAVDSVDVVAAPVPTVRFLAPVWEEPTETIAADAKADRLLAQYSRAIASRHKTRAAKYRAAWIAHIAAIDASAIA